MKKQFLNLKKSRWLLFTLLTMMVGASPTWADELTVYDGTATNANLPIYGYYADSKGTASEFIIPASDLADMKDKVIEQLTFYISSPATKKFGATFNVYLEEVEGENYDDSSASQLTDSKTLVYTGALDADGTTLVIPFDTEYTYNGGNLLIATEVTTVGSYTTASFYGTTTTVNTGRCNKGSTNRFKFIPKTTFAYGAANPYKKPASISVGEIVTTTAVVTWTSGSGDSSETGWNLDYKKSADDSWTEVHGLGASPLSYTLTELESNTAYDVRVQAVYSGGESKFVATTFKTAKVATSATGFTDNFETDKGWELINGTVPNKWVRGTGTNNGGSYSLYISNDGANYNSSYGSSSLVYASKLFYFEAGDYTVSYDWLCNGESGYDFLRVGIASGDTELAASTSYNNLGSTSTLPSGWTMWLDGGSPLSGSTTWATKSVDITIETAGNYQVVFGWRNDYSGGSTPAAIDNFKILGAAPVLELGGDVVGTTLAFGSVAETTNKTIRITNSGKVAMENITLTETADEDNVFAYAELPKTTLAANEYMDVQVTFSGSSAKDYTGTFRIAADDCDPIDVTVTATYSNSPATMAVTLGEDAVGASVAFGNVGKQATKTFTVTNDGDQTLNVTIESNNTTDFTVAPATLAVTGHTSETFTVTFLYDENALDVEKTANITITASNDGISPVTFAVTGTRIEQWSEDFSGNALPDGWERTSTTYWTFADGVAKSTYSSTNYYLITPSLTVEEGASLSFDVRSVGTWNTLTVEKQLNNGTWTSCKDIASNADFGNDTEIWKTFTIDGLEAGNYKFRFNARNFWLDNFEGFKRNMNDPKLGIYSDAECTAAVATSVTKDFGFATETQTATYYIKNDGTGTMTLSLGDAPAGLTQSLDKTSVAAGEYATLTITLPAESKGYNGGNVVVTATDLGTFTVAVSGVIVDEGKMNLDFSTATIPTTWTTNSWSKNADGYAEVGYSGSPVTMQTSNLTAVAGEDLVVLAKMSNTYSTYSFGVKYKKTDAEEWSDLIPAANIGTSYVMLHGTIAEAGTYQLQFNGQYTQIQRIYGLSVPEEPVMVVYDGESLAAATYNFGNVSDEADAVKTFTVKNDGKAELTGLAAALSGEDAEHYSVEVSATTVAEDGTATITVKQLKDNLGAHAATLTISATDLDDQVIALSGNTYDHTKLFADFEDGNLPDGWTKGSYWNISQVSGNTNHSLGHSYGSSYASSVITTPLTVAEDETLTFGASRYYSSYAPTLKVRYTADGGLTWSEYTDFSSEITSSYSGNTFKELTLTDVPTGTVVLEFYGSYVRIDNIYGFTATTAPMLALTESSTAVENNSTKEFGTLTAEATATYTLTNNGTADMVSTVATTGVATAAISGEAEGVTIADNKVTLAAGKSATITLTLPYETPYGEKTGAMTITTEGWVADFTVNYTATTVDPTALYVDFADNAKPEGWYNDGWTYSNGYASAAYVANKQVITQKLTSAGADDVLSFDAWAYSTTNSSFAPVLTVEYSTDRLNWTAFENQPSITSTTSQTFQVSGAPAGDYYVRFTGSYVYMDNISGWHKVTGIDHDLYVSYTNIPTATKVPETSIQATATVYSLRAAETGVYAKLFFGENVVATATAQDIAKDGSATFSLTGNVPTEEDTYAAKIVVYYGDESVAAETETVDVVVAHTRTLEITDFALTSEATAEADANNQFTSTFNVTVKNTGSIAYTPAQVSVNVTDAEGNAYGEATTWTAANSQTMFIVPGEYTNDNAVLAIYRFNTGEEDAEWAELTKISDNFYSAELNNKAKFIVVRLKNSEAEGYDDSNNGLNWANKYNQSVDLVPGTANCFTFNGWDDKKGDNHYFGYSTMTELAKGVSTTLKVTVTTSALEGGEFTFKAKENMSNTVSSASATVTVSAAAPKFALYQDATPINDGDDVEFGVQKAAKTFTYTIVNEGNKMMEKPAITAPEGFEASYVAANGAEADWMLFFYKENTVDADQGNFKATATDGKFVLENVNVPASGVNFAVHKKNGSDWTDIYGYSDEGGHLDATAKATKLATATNASGWMTIAAGTYDFIWNATDLTLTAKPAGAILAGDSQDVNVTLKAEQGKVSGNLVFTYPVDATTNKTFTLALSGRSISEDTWVVDFEDGKIPSNWDNSNSWTVYETDDNHVARLTGWDAKAIITPRLAAEKDEILTFDVLSLGNSISYAYSTDRKSWSDEITISAPGEQTFTAPADGNYYLRFTGRNAYLDNLIGFTLNPNTLELDETETPDLAEDFYETITLNRTFAAGWNTVCLPFEISNVTGFFGANAKAYDFTDYTSEGALNFQVTSALEAGKPYIVYVESAINDAIILSNTTVSSATASNTVQNEATFQGTYAPMAAGTMTGKYGVTKDAKIAKGTSTASMKGFRAYFELPDGVSARIAFFDEDGTVTYIGGVSVDELTNGTVYNMQGQRITSPNKSGLYIINGKKTVVKKH